jgi:hypothetical protein
VKPKATAIDTQKPVIEFGDPKAQGRSNTITLNSLKNKLIPNVIKKGNRRPSKREPEMDLKAREEKINPNSNSI